MADVFSKKKRSEVMSKIRSKNTALEKSIFRELRRSGVYFQCHYKKVSGCPDIALPRLKKAVFIDGDFWHGWKFARRQARMAEYWRNKIVSNVKRDHRNRARLRRAGWAVLRVWEHEIEKRPTETIRKIILFLK